MQKNDNSIFYQNKKWLKEQLDNGNNIASISKQLGCSYQTVSKYAKLFNLNEEKKYKNQEWLKNELKSKTIETIALEQQIDIRTIKCWAKKYQLLKEENLEKPLYQNKEWLLQKLKEENYNLKEIAKKYNFKEFNLKHWCKKYGLISFIKQKRYEFNEEYFKVIDTEEKAYWLGFLMADGSIDKELCYLKFKLKEEDKYIIEQFKKDIKCDRPTRIEKVQYASGIHSFAVFEIGSKAMIKDLIYHGCGPKKSGKEVLPDSIPEEMIRHFIRGFMDGDGTVSKKTRLISWISLSYNVLLSIKMHLENKLNIKSIDIYFSPSKDYRHQQFRYTICSKDAENILDYLYKDATRYLTRKYKNYQKYKSPSFQKCNDKNYSNSVKILEDNTELSLNII